jgi:hypothetical protein
MRQQVADMELELQITKQQLYAVVDNLVHLKNSMGEDVLPGLDTGTWTYTTGGAAGVLCGLCCWGGLAWRCCQGGGVEHAGGRCVCAGGGVFARRKGGKG